MIRVAFYLYFVIYACVFIISDMAGVSPFFIKSISLFFLLIAIFRKRKTADFNKTSNKISIIYTVILFALILIQVFFYGVSDTIIKLLPSFLIFIVVSSYKPKDILQILTSGVKITTMILNLLLVLSCLRNGSFEYFRSDVNGLDKPTFTLFYSIFYAIAFVEYTNGVNKKENALLLISSLVLNIFVVQSKLAITSIFLVAVVYYFSNNDNQYKKNFKKILFLILVFLVTVFFIFPQYFQIPDTFKEMINMLYGKEVFSIDLVQQDDNTYTIRQAIRAYCIQLFLENPIMGIGIGHYVDYAGSAVTFSNHGQIYTITETESTILGVMVEGGIIYLLSFLTLFRIILKKSFKNLRSNIGYLNNSIVFSISIVLLYICFNNDFIDSSFWIIVGICLNIVCNADSKFISNDKKQTAFKGLY